jgi:enoyl-CoA hydratase/carnithine racemase
LPAHAGVAPAEAQALGLVHHVVLRQELEFDALAIAQRLAGRSPVKRLVYDAASKPLGRAVRMEHARPSPRCRLRGLSRTWTNSPSSSSTARRPTGSQTMLAADSGAARRQVVHDR